MSKKSDKMPSCDFSHKMKVEGDEGVGISLTGNVSMDDFELLKVLGKGAYGKVFQVRTFYSFYIHTYHFCGVLFFGCVCVSDDLYNYS